MQNFQQSMPGQGAVRAASAVIIVSFVLALLYLGRVVFEPLTIAVLLAFVLTPPTRWLRRHHVGRHTSVIVVVVLALAVIGAFGVVMESEVTRLAQEIPQYQNNLREKIISLNRTLSASGAFRRFSATLNNLSDELKGGSTNSASAPGVAGGRQPIPVEVQAPQPAALQYLQNLIGPFVVPLTMTGLLVMFLIFILFYREDLRDRVLRLGGTGDLHRTTVAMDDAGRRLSRYFLIQSAINASFGFCIFLGLWAIGVPNPVLWGALAAILRFVPYVGTPIAALMPLLLAAAIDPGWTKVLVTGALFLGLEGVTGQAIEPIVQGQQTGLSPIAIVLSQLFWTLIWGVPGLLLAVPVTVCIAVLGRHIHALDFIGVILGDEPPLAPHEGFYQRLLAGDATEATFQAEKLLATEPLSDYYDAVPMAALSLAQADAAEGKLPKEKQAELLSTIEEIVEDLADYSDGTGTAKDDEAAPAEEKNPPVLAPGAYPILLIPARSAIDQAASILLAHVLEKRGLAPAIEPYAPGRLSRNYKPLAPQARIACISCFVGASQNPAPVRYLIRRWRRILPDTCFVACFWLLESDSAKLEEWGKAVGADFAAASLKDAARICYDEALGAFESAVPAVPIPQDAKALKAAE
ncbi:MAG: AI-2E family transporter [Rhodomicrobium sp.]